MTPRLASVHHRSQNHLRKSNSSIDEVPSTPASHISFKIVSLSRTSLDNRLRHATTAYFSRGLDCATKLTFRSSQSTIPKLARASLLPRSQPAGTKMYSRNSEDFDILRIVNKDRSGRGEDAFQAMGYGWGQHRWRWRSYLVSAVCSYWREEDG